MVLVVVREQALVGGFVDVVELFEQARAQFLDERTRVESGKEQSERAEQHVGVDEVGADRVVDTRILHLHRDLEARVRHGAVHLPDGSRRERNRIPLREHAVGIAAELVAND